MIHFILQLSKITQMNHTLKVPASLLFIESPSRHRLQMMVVCDECCPCKPSTHLQCINSRVILGGKEPKVLPRDWLSLGRDGTRRRERGEGKDEQLCKLSKILVPKRTSP